MKSASKHSQFQFISGLISPSTLCEIRSALQPSDSLNSQEPGKPRVHRGAISFITNEFQRAREWVKSRTDTNTPTPPQCRSVQTHRPAASVADWITDVAMEAGFGTPLSKRVDAQKCPQHVKIRRPWGNTGGEQRLCHTLLPARSWNRSFFGCSPAYYAFKQCFICKTRRSRNTDGGSVPAGRGEGGTEKK